MGIRSYVMLLRIVNRGKNFSFSPKSYAYDAKS